MIDNNKRLRAVLEYLYSQHRITNKEVAEKLGITQQQIANILRSTNKNTPLRALEDIKIAFTVELSDYDFNSRQAAVTKKDDAGEVIRLRTENEILRKEIELLREQNNKMLDKILKS